MMMLTGQTYLVSRWGFANGPLCEVKAIGKWEGSGVGPGGPEQETQQTGEGGGRVGLLVFRVIIRIYRSMLLVSTEDAGQRARLQEQFKLADNYFQVPARESGVIEGMVRSICFEYFQNSPPAVAERIKQLVAHSFTLTYSLTLLREIMALLSRDHDTLRNQRNYIAEVGRVLSEEQSGTEDDYSLGEDNDHLFELAEQGNIRLTREIESTDFHEEYSMQINFRCPTKTEKTMQTAHHEHAGNPEEIVLKEKLQCSNNLSSFFYSAETVYTNEWWKNDKGNDSSKSISQFQKRGANIITQKSFNHLLLDELKYDLKREIELGKDIQKHEELEVYKYNKMMKDQRLSAKLKKRRKK